MQAERRQEAQAWIGARGEVWGTGGRRNTRLQRKAPAVDDLCEELLVRWIRYKTVADTATHLAITGKRSTEKG